MHRAVSETVYLISMWSQVYGDTMYVLIENDVLLFRVDHVSWLAV
jgi:hypothetical protein